MSFSAWLHSIFSSRDKRGGSPAEGRSGFPPSGGNEGPGALDSLLALLPDANAGSSENALSMLLALGNLFRDRGDIERAVRFREKLLSLATTPQARAAALFELGHDYRKAGLIDRATAAFQDARRQGYPENLISGAMAYVHADSGNFKAAAEEFGKIGMPQAEACFLVRQAEEEAATGADNEAYRLLMRALETYPPSPEARLSLTAMSLVSDDVPQSLEQATACLTLGNASTRLILLEGLLAFVRGGNAPYIAPQSLANLAAGLGAHIATLEQDAVLCLYAGFFMLQADNRDGAEHWFSKSLIMDPDFWAARLAILTLAAKREHLPLLLSQQIDFFTRQGERSKRFYCPPCGMRRDSVFSFCPRCQAWHAAAFRTRIT